MADFCLSPPAAAGQKRTFELVLAPAQKLPIKECRSRIYDSGVKQKEGRFNQYRSLGSVACSDKNWLPSRALPTRGRPERNEMVLLVGCDNSYGKKHV